MLDKIADIKRKYHELSTKMSSNDVASDLDLMIKLGKEMATLDPIYKLACTYEQCVNDIAEAEDILNHETDPELVHMAKDQLTEAKKRLAQCEHDLTIALLPKDENDERNIFLEIRPAA
jgi:peptide chain release factor 1